jgi:putative endonuclease
MTDARHTRGRQGEELAARHFEALGFAVLARNHRTRYGELDLVAYDGETLVFAEVKTRLAGSRLRFDGVAVLIDRAGALVRLDHLEAAF